MNIFDGVVLVILALCMFGGYRRGLIKTLFRLASFFISIGLTYQLYPYVSQWLRGTQMYENLKSAVTRSLGLEAMFQPQTVTPQSDLIGNLPLPGALLDALASNNTPDIYGILNVQSIGEYIGGYIANIVVNIMAMVGVFILVYLVMRVISGALDVIGRLPVIKTFNHAGGLAIGVLQGILIVWIGFALLHLFIISPNNAQLFDMLNASLFAKWFYNNNFIFSIITKV